LHAWKREVFWHSEKEQGDKEKQRAVEYEIIEIFHWRYIFYVKIPLRDVIVIFCYL
jgi:hypothetical protein